MSRIRTKCDVPRGCSRKSIKSTYVEREVRGARAKNERKRDWSMGCEKRDDDRRDASDRGRDRTHRREREAAAAAAHASDEDVASEDGSDGGYD